MTNLEKQTDEILALQSIFDTKFCLLDDNNHYEILIDFDQTEPFIIQYNNEKFIMNHLPPFTLIIHYHDKYPSDYPPSFMLSCFYFSKASLQNLCQKLDNYSFIKDEVCVYDWIELIKHEITNELILQTKDDEQINDPRALNGYSNEKIDEIYQSLINYNNEQHEKQFRNQLQTCLKCTDIIPGMNFIRLHRCGHFYCRPCLNNYVRITLNNGKFGEKLHCPQNQCQKALLPNEIKQIIQDAQLYQRYERLTLQHALESMNNVIWCPRCQSAVLIGSGDDNLAVCDQCHYTFCKKCKEKYHFQAMCPEDHLAEQLRLQQRKIRERIAKQQIEERERTQNGKDQKRIAKKREKAHAESLRIDKEKKDLDEKNLAKQQYREIAIDLSEEDALLEEILNAERMEVLNTQPCPNCHVKIEKNGGCLHMYCSRCGYSFIWSALERRQPLQMTSLLYHSSDAMPVQSIKTELYKKSDTAKVSEQSKEDENEQDSTVLINNRSFIGTAIVKRVKQCPNNSCNKLNVKMGEDNWIKQKKMDIDINKIFDKGPFSIGEVSYEYPIVNDTEITPFSTNLTTQIRGQLYFPNNTQGSLPILVFLPGKHADCRLLALPGYPGLDAGATDIFGHCQDNLPRVASHLGYAYLSEYFASHGYIVISIDVALINNRWPIPGDLTLNFVRARIVLRTLQKMIEFNNNAEMSKQILNGIDLSGKFDFTQVGLMGHSRGGEGVRNAYNMLMENKGPSDTPKWRERLPGVMIKAIMEIVPMYYGENGTKFGVENVPWAMLVSGCEDDEIDYAHVYLAYRQLQSAKRPNHVIHVYGANHEYFNTEWQVGIPACFGDQDPLWDVNAPTFKVSDIFPPAAGTPLDYTLLKINGSESQRKTAIFALAAFFRAYVGVNADPEFAKLLNPFTSLPDNMTELGRQYFDNTQSIQLFNGTGNITGSSGVEIMPLRMYAESMFPSFATSYDNSPISPPQFFSDPPKKGNLSLGCLEQIENGVHINFDNNKQSEVIISFNKVEIKKISAIDIQLARRSSCWFTSTHSSTCEEPREMKLNIQLQTNTGFSSNTTIFLKSRYNLQFTRCEAMSFPPEKIGYLPVMFETIRILVTNDQYISGLKLSSQNGGSLVLDNIAAIIQQSSNASFLSKSIYLLFSLFFISVIFHAYYFLQI